MGQERAEFFVRARGNAAGGARNPFARTLSITLPRDGEPPAFDLYATDQGRIVCFHDAVTDTAAYLWGRAAHLSKLKGTDLLRQSVQAFQNARHCELRSLLGYFVIIIEDRRARQITFISDALGLFPWFSGSHAGRLVAGSSVPGICRAGLSTGKADYNAIGSWLKFNFDCTGGSIVADYKRLDPGLACTFDVAGKLGRVEAYGRLDFGRRLVPQEELVDQQHAIVSRSFDALTDGLSEANLPVSGGYDSRYLLALATRRADIRFHVATLDYQAHETAIAQRAAASLGAAMELVPCKKQILDFFDEPFICDAAGFLCGRNLTNYLAARHPGMPLVSGFLGDGVIRSSMTEAGAAYFGRDFDPSPSAGELTEKMLRRFTSIYHMPRLLGARIDCNITERARAGIEQVVRRGMAAGKPVIYSDLFYYQRCYFANVFLQHLDVAPAIVPYCSWALMNLRTSHARSCFTGENHQILFKRHFPAVFGIPNSYSVGHAKNGLVVHPTRHLRKWSIDLLAALARGRLAAVPRRRLADLGVSGFLVEPKYQQHITFLAKLYLFEQKLRDCRVQFDWAEL